ncbi:MAG: hypothetical protein K2M47_00810 [Clostridiales bacterium]|nr:hypothetical protein [Clostridiales bacterium]MDE6200410.1 hypothetical protein [Clostridiales bacterium]
MKKDATKKLTKDALADREYKRLIEIYKGANVDEVKLKVNDELIRKVAELFAILEDIKDLPSIIYNKNNPHEQKETAAGKARVKYMAQYSTCMQRLNKELLGAVEIDDDDLDKYK